jgi:hypothetical protein
MLPVGYHEACQFDHERLDVYRVALDFLVLAERLIAALLRHDTRPFGCHEARREKPGKALTRDSWTGTGTGTGTGGGVDMHPVELNAPRDRTLRLRRRAASASS